MTKNFVAPASLERLLHEALHGREDPVEPDRLRSDVWPPPEIIITLAFDIDGTLDVRNRQRYFVTIADEDDEPLIQHDSHFGLPQLFAEASKDEARHSPFMRGPVRWLWLRFQPFARILLWPHSQQRQSNGVWFWNDYERRELPRLCNWLEKNLPDPSLVGAVVLDLGNPEHCAVLWDVANLVGCSHHNFYVSHEKASEVYLLHHHDSIYISIPDKKKRQALLDELARWPNLIKDCSGFTV